MSSRAIFTCIVLYALFSRSVSEVTARSGNVTLVCRQGWRLWGSSCYMWVTSEMQHSDARNLCALYQSDLLQIEDEVESRTVAGLAPLTPLWMGRQITDLCYGYWDEGEPSPNAESGECVGLHGNGLWGVVSCHQPLPFFCERPACIDGTFDCGHGRCVSKRRTCNGINDCGNNLDEMECASTTDPQWPPPVPCSYRVESDTGSVNFNLQSDRYTDCVWTIVSSPATQLVLTFVRIDLEDNLDTLEVRSGGQTTSDSQVLHTFTGQQVSATGLNSLNNMIILRLLTDWSARGSSFLLQWSVFNSPRRWTVGTHWRQLSTPFYPQSTRVPFYSEWLVTGTQRGTITLKIQDVDVEGEWSILVYNGATYSDVLVNATDTESLISPAVYFSTSSLVRVVLTGKHVTREGKGILLQAKAGCDLEVDDFPGILSSPGISKKVYPPSLVCSWLLTTPNYGYGNEITLRFLLFHLQTTDSFVEVYNGTADSDPPLHTGAGYTGDFRSSEIRVQGVGPVFVRFTSSHFKETGGFQMWFSVDCEAIPDSVGLVKSSSDTSIGTAVRVSCRSGFAFRQEELYMREVVLTCMWTGRWNVDRLPSCQVVYCGSPPPVFSGYVESYSGRVTHGSTATYSCYPGHRLVGHSVVTCLDTGQWSTPPNCESTTKQVTCGDAPDISNAEKVYLSSFGNIVEYRCESGYEVLGSPRRLCQKDGAWSLSSPRCVKKRCPLPDVRNGVLSATEAVELGSTVYLTCRDGYALSSTGSRVGYLVCGADSTFGDGITCEDVDECAGSVCQWNQVCVNTVGSYTCKCGAGFKHLSLQCINVDECLEGTHRCEQICTDTQGSYTCSCNQGFQLRQEGDNFPCDRLDQTDDDDDDDENTAGCPALTSMGSVTQKSLVRDIHPVTPLLPGQSVTVVCGRQDGSTENRTLYCAYNTDTQGFSLQGDSPLCQVVDCGPIHVHSVQLAPTLTSTEYGASFVYMCAPGAVIAGQSSTGDNVVSCLANGSWGYGSLTCLVGKCGDPGTPPGTVQVYDSYSEGSHVTYMCEKLGYSLSHNATLTCLLVHDVHQWNLPPPTCSDVTPPTFTSCEGGEKTLKVNKMEIPDISVIATDTSGTVASLTVSPATFNVAAPILTDTTVVYTATDPAGNAAICRVRILLKDPTPGSLQCPDLLTYTVTSAMTSVHHVADRLVYSGGQLVNPPQIEVSPRTLDTELDQRVTLQTEDGVNSTCAFRVQVVAGNCFHDTSQQADNAFTTRVDDSAYTTHVTCRTGYSFPDGSVSHTYTCTGVNQWSPGDPSQPCLALAYKMSYYIELQFTSAVFLNSESYCRVNVTRVYSYLSAGDSLLNNLCGRGRQTDSDRFYRFLLVSVQYEEPLHKFRHRVSLTLQLENFVGDLATLESCSDSIASRKADLFTVNTGECEFSVELLINATTAAGDNCGTGYNDTGADDLCLLCPAGTYWGSNGTCEECPDGQYQNEAGQETCNYCDGSTVSLLPRTSAKNCIRQCLAGFVSGTGQSPCEVCDVDTYWSSPTVCLPCPGGWSTLRVSGASNVTFCKAPCPPGHYSTSGYVPCTACPHHFYQTTAGQTSCTECLYDTVTVSAGSSASADCVPIETSKHSCSKCSDGTQTCEYHGHRGICYCKPGYTGPLCEALYDHCTSMPCYHNGECTPLVDNYRCLCPSGSSGVDCEADIVDDCVNNSCSEVGVCRDLVADYQCVCADSQNMDKLCNPIDSDICTPNPCEHGGTCFSQVQGRIQCVCQPGTTGSMCEIIIDNCELNLSGCLYGGTCVNAINSYRCECPSGLTGDHCQVETRTCASGYCRNGVCTPQGVCTCVPSYQMDDRGECTVYDYCVSSPCAVGSARCMTQSGGYKCECMDGYEGVRCQFKVDYCKVNFCLHGSCRNLDTNYICLCDDGWEGKWCDESVDDCTNQCTGLLSASGCQDLHLDFTCICRPGYTGKHCTVDIDECASFPCQHGGTCNGGLADYTCTCMEGWEGKNCQNIKNTCTPVSCLNDGICYPVFNTHYCSCPKGTDGDRCEVAPDMCNIVQPCLSASCQTSNGTALCNCAQFYSGASCELIKDCSTAPCQNGASCSLESPSGYSCHCPPGFTGKHCENSLCTGACPVGTTCVYQGVQTFCLCPPPLLLSGSECRAYSSDFDLYLEGGGEALPTRSLSPFKLTPNTTLMLWIGYFTAGSSLLLCQLDSSQVLMELHHDRTVFIDGNRKVTLSFGSSNLEQVKGQWSHVTVTWSFNRIFTVFINGIQINQTALSSDIHVSDNLYFASFDTSFTGYISQLTAWRRVLSLTEIRSAAQSVTLHRVDDLQLGWTRYVLNGWSRTYRPSRARLRATLCDTDRVQAPNCQGVQGGNPFPCPRADVSFTTGERITHTQDVVALPPTDQQLTYYTTLTGSTVSWGRYDVVFALTDAQDRYTICRVKLYIRDTVSCDTSGFPASTACGSNSVRDVCGPGRPPSVPTPLTLQCGRLGSFNLTHPTSAYSPPPCGVMTDAPITIALTLKYDMDLLCTDLSRNTLVRLLRDKVRSYLSATWPTLCVDGCSDLKITSTCDDAFAIVEVTFDHVPEMITKADTGVTASTEGVLYTIATQTQELDVPTIGQLDKETVEVHTQSQCNGTTAAGKCVSCGPGSYLDQSAGRCQRCPIGTYTDASSQLSCKPCLNGTTTALSGSKTMASCITLCPAGSMVGDDGLNCRACPLGFFQNKTGQVFCFPCPVDKTTEDISAISLDDCSVPVALSSDTTTTSTATTPKTTSATSTTVQTTPESLDETTSPSSTPTIPQTTGEQKKDNILDVATLSAIAATVGGLLLLAVLAGCCYTHRRQTRNQSMKNTKVNNDGNEVDNTQPIYEEVHPVDTNPDEAYITPVFSSDGTAQEDTANDYSVLNVSTRGDNPYSKIRSSRKSHKARSRDKQRMREREMFNLVFPLTDAVRGRSGSESDDVSRWPGRSRQIVSDSHLDRRNKRIARTAGPPLRMHNGQIFMGYRADRM